jgi:hypothetical protein
MYQTAAAAKAANAKPIGSAIFHHFVKTHSKKAGEIGDSPSKPFERVASR